MALAVYDHVELLGSDHSDGIYRVVGTTAERVTLLRVADADGSRVHSGELVSLSRDSAASLPAAANPDENSGSLGTTLRSMPTVAYWGVRAFGWQLAARPVATLIAAVAVVVGAIGAGALPVPSLATDVLFVGGVVGLVAIGEGYV